MSLLNQLVRCSFLLALTGAALPGQWVELFDGKTLNGWRVVGPKANIVVEDGAIVGVSFYVPPPEGAPAPAPGAPRTGPTSTYLCPNKEYGDFILEFEVKKAPGVNSGVQFRSQIAGSDTRVKAIRQGKEEERLLRPDTVYGYQFEIVDAERGNTGNIYDESRRGILLDNFKTTRPEALKAFKDNEWNRCRIEARGDRIRTWVNGVAAADFRDSMSARGVIGLQIHGVRRPDPKPAYFRNIRIQELR